MWTIVCFETDNTVDVVPDFWYKNGFCEWPNRNNRIDSKTSVKRRVNPDEIHFKKYKARALLTNIGTYQEAECKATKAQLTSDLSSNDDDKGTKQYTKMKNILPEKTNELLISQLPNPPELEESESESIETDDIDKDKDYNNVPEKNIFTQLSWDSENSSINTTMDNELQPKRNITYENSVQSIKRKKTAHNMATTSDTKYEENVNECQNSQPEMLILPSTSTPEYESDQAFKKFLKRSLITLKYDVENVQRRLDGLETLLEKINEKLAMQPNIMMTDASDEDIIFIENETDLNKMEDKLINDSLYRNAVIRTLSRFLGSNLSETIRKMMQKLFSDSFLMNYSFIGFKGKNQFSTLQSCAVIFEAVRSTKKYSDVPNIDIEKPVKNWMGQATQREKIKKQKLAILNN